MWLVHEPGDNEERPGDKDRELRNEVSGFPPKQPLWDRSRLLWAEKVALFEVVSLTLGRCLSAMIV